MHVNQSFDCLELRRRYQARLNRHAYMLHAFDMSLLPAPSALAANAYLFERFIAWLKERRKIFRRSFSVWAALSPLGWWTGHLCACLYVSGRELAFEREARTWSELVEMEYVDPRDEQTMLLCVFGPDRATLQVSVPPIAQFMPAAISAAECGSSAWMLAGLRACEDGAWLADETAVVERRVFASDAEALVYFGGAAQVHMEQLPLATVERLWIARAHPALGPDVVAKMLTAAKDMNDLNRFLDQAALVAERL